MFELYAGEPVAIEEGVYHSERETGHRNRAIGHMLRNFNILTEPLSGAASRRLATFWAGMAFGEMALLDRAPRSAVVTADAGVECDLLKVEDFEALGQSHPHIKIVLLRNLALGLSRQLRKPNREISVFDY